MIDGLLVRDIAEALKQRMSSYAALTFAVQIQSERLQISSLEQIARQRAQPPFKLKLNSQNAHHEPYDTYQLRNHLKRLTRCVAAEMVAKTWLPYYPEGLSWHPVKQHYNAIHDYNVVVEPGYLRNWSDVFYRLIDSVAMYIRQHPSIEAEVSWSEIGDMIFACGRCHSQITLKAEDQLRFELGTPLKLHCRPCSSGGYIYSGVVQKSLATKTKQAMVQRVVRCAGPNKKIGFR